jgi:hypothetical protein
MPDCKFKMMRCQGGRLAVRRAFKILGWSARCELAANGFQPGSFNTCLLPECSPAQGILPERNSQ